MEYLHASLILHSTGKKITEKAVGDILTAAGVTPDKNRIKGLVAALADVNIEEALKSAAVMPSVAATPAPQAATAVLTFNVISANPRSIGTPFPALSP